MPQHRVVSGLVALAVTTTLTVAGAGAASAVPRTVPIEGTRPKPQVFFIKGSVGTDFAGQKVVVQRKVRPGAPWKKWKKDETSRTGKYKVRVYRAAGSPQTCYRVRVRAFNGLEKGQSRTKCIIRVF